jgi:hypothetical protein
MLARTVVEREVGLLVPLTTHGLVLRRLALTDTAVRYADLLVGFEAKEKKGILTQSSPALGNTLSTVLTNRKKMSDVDCKCATSRCRFKLISLGASTYSSPQCRCADSVYVSYTVGTGTLT